MLQSLEIDQNTTSACGWGSGVDSGSWRHSGVLLDGLVAWGVTLSQTSPGLITHGFSPGSVPGRATLGNIKGSLPHCTVINVLTRKINNRNYSIFCYWGDTVLVKTRGTPSAPDHTGTLSLWECFSAGACVVCSKFYWHFKHAMHTSWMYTPLHTGESCFQLVLLTRAYELFPHKT